MKINHKITSFLTSFGLCRSILSACGLLCFLPVLLDLPLHPPVEPDSALAFSFESLYYHNALIASIAVSVPMLMDYAMDVITGNKKSRSMGVVGHRDLILTLLLPDGILLWVILPTKKYAYFPCILNAREIFLLYAFINRMKINFPQAWTLKSSAPLAFSFSAWKLFSVYTAFAGDLNLSTISTVTFSLQLLAICVLILAYIRCYYIILDFDGGADNKLLYRYIIPYMTVFLMAWIGIIIIGFETGSTIWTNTNPRYCISYTLIVGLFGSFVSVLNGRMIRTNAEETEAREAGVELEFDNPEE
eukprot:gene15575-32902_t